MLVGVGAVVVFMAVIEFGRGDATANPWPWAGLDYRTYTDATARWIGGGSFYPPAQLAGPYELTTNQEVLYPPTTIPLFVPFVFLPAFLWWVIPTTIVAWATWAHRPNPIAWALIAVAVVTPWTWIQYVMGNPVIWTAAALSLATHFPALGPAVLLKPTLAPLALFGVRTRGWWITLGIGVLVALSFLPLWSDYLIVLRNAHGGRVGLLYGLGDVSLMSIPLLAWAGRRPGARSIDFPGVIRAH